MSNKIIAKFKVVIEGEIEEYINEEDGSIEETKDDLMVMLKESIKVDEVAGYHTKSEICTIEWEGENETK